MRSFIPLALLAFTGLIVHAADPQPPITTGLRVATCGHSFHVFTYRQVEQIAVSAGLKHQLVGLSSIGGSTVQKHWDVQEEKSAVKQVLKAGGADVLTLSPIWLPDEAIEQFLKLGIEHNPALRITVQEYWMPNDEYEPVYPLQTRKKVDHNATDIAKLRDATMRYAKDIEAYVKGINQRLGKDAVVIVPVGMAAVTLREKIVKGEAPGLKQQSELFRDNWGHALLPLQFLSSYCHYAVIYRRSPVGLPLPLAFRALKDMSDDDKAKLNTLLQQIAWDTVSAHPMSGITNG
ncbi:MAG: hypothetical protein IAE77_15120 [Prosthecobacter sp.]|jgi:hypothetical protein|uniref:hypothetical protein n=1 Tax=Prosthecobacter sp. TaxID=1965333 RepID=UPI0019D8FEE4|nr:hypothetical protein [Prosthecobacter sp.]MBE2284789.1 hypothetical protein [Prosthecobacter sp.]